MRIAVGPRTPVRVHRPTFRVAHARIVVESGPLGLDSQRNRRICIDVPGVIELEISDLGAHQVRVGESRIFILRGYVGERDGLGDGLTNRRRGQVGRARVAFAGVLEHGDTDAAIVGVFEALDLAETRCCRQARVLAGSRFGLVDAALLRLVEGQGDEMFEIDTAEHFTFRNCSHGRLPAPVRGAAAQGTVDGGQRKAQQKRDEA